jgi:hypothetical protein
VLLSRYIGFAPAQLVITSAQYNSQGVCTGGVGEGVPPEVRVIVVLRVCWMFWPYPVVQVMEK